MTGGHCTHFAEYVNRIHNGVVTQFGLKPDFRCAHESFSTLQRLAKRERQNSRLAALKQLPLRPLRFAGRGPEKTSNSAPEVRLQAKLSHYS